jgi:hypothetical protein
MRLAEIKQFAAEAKKLTASAKPPGPRTEQGKLRSALNATKHGLAGKYLLLPGEDRDEYERRMDAVFEALAPTNEAEAQLVALVADDLWKLERLGKIEQGVSLGRIEELLGQTPSAEGAGAITNVIATVAKAITTWETEPIPSQRDAEFTRRLGLMSSAISFVDMMGAELPAGVTDVCYPLLARLRGESGRAELPLAHAAEPIVRLLKQHRPGGPVHRHVSFSAVTGVHCPSSIRLPLNGGPKGPRRAPLARPLFGNYLN